MENHCRDSWLTWQLRAPESQREGLPKSRGGQAYCGGSPRAEVALLTVGIPVVGMGDAAEALLPSCVPDLEGRQEQRDQT